MASSSVSIEMEESRIDELFMRVAESESSLSLPEGEWSFDTLLPEAEANDKEELYIKGLFDPGSGEVCTKYIALSDSSVLRHPYYNYPCILDPGIVEALVGADVKKLYPMDGQDLYLDLCKEMKIAPIRMFYSGLMDNAIDLSYYGVCQKSVRAMCMALTYNQTVERIDFTSNFLGLDACYHLGQLLAENHVLQEIVLNECNIGKEGIRRLVVNLHFRNTDLLDLSSNNLGDEGFQVLLEALIKDLTHCEYLPLFYFNPRAREGTVKLKIANNDLGHKSVVGFNEALEYNNHFTHLDLSWNQFGLVIKAAEKLLRSLSESEYLVDLKLRFNYIVNGDVLQLLMRSDSIRHLDLSRNKLQSHTVKFIVNGFRRSKLKSLNLSRNPFTAQDAMAILNGFARSSFADQLYMNDIDVNPDFVELATTLRANRNATITHGRVVRDFTISEVNMKEIIVRRFEFLSRSKSKKKPKLDFCVYFLTLDRKQIPNIDPKIVLMNLKQGNVIIEEDLMTELVSAFPGPLINKGDKSINVAAVCDYMRRLFPEKQPDPPTPEPELEPEPPKKKGKRAKGAKGTKGTKGAKGAKGAKGTQGTQGTKKGKPKKIT